MLGLGSSLALGGALSGFEPSNISSLIHWWKHASGLEDAGGAFPDDDERIEVWRDSKGSNDAETFDTDGSGTDAMKWDDTNKALVSDISGGFDISTLTLGSFSLYFRIQFLQAPNATDVFTQADPASTPDHNAMFISVRSPTLFRARIDSTNRNFTPPTLATGQYYNFGLERDSSNNLRLYVDGTESSTGALTDTTNVIIDRMVCGLGDLYVTTLVFNDALSSDDRAALETYLSNI